MQNLGRRKFLRKTAVFARNTAIIAGFPILFPQIAAAFGSPPRTSCTSKKHVSPSGPSYSCAVAASAAQPLFLAADRMDVLLVSTLAVVAVNAAHNVLYTADRGNVLPRRFPFPEIPVRRTRMNYRSS